MHTRTLLTLLVFLAFCNPISAADPPVPDFSLDVAAVPETTGLPVMITDDDYADKTPALYAWDIFAWQTFAAMNWPAIEPTESNGYLRGFPDLTKSFPDVKGGEDGPLVWETLKEKREMFIHGATTPEAARPNPWSSPFEYGPDRRIPMGKHAKRLFGTAKFTTLDETVEVRAETFGNAFAPYASSGFENLPTVARVFRGPPELTGSPQHLASPGNAVRYEVKVNYDFFKYVVDNGLYFDPAAAARAQQRPPIQLPWRTSLSNPGFNFLTQKPADLPYVQGYRADRTVAAYRAGAQAQFHPNGVQPNAPVPTAYRAPAPPRMGAIHLKAAWVPIKEAEKDKFITREAEYFVGKDKEPGTATFGLIGLHIIQRIKVVAPTNRINSQTAHGRTDSTTPAEGATGGTFIYSTWEHRDIHDGMDPYPSPTTYTYTNYFQIGPSTFTPVPHLDSPIEVKRVFPILDHTHQVNEKVWSYLDTHHKGSVWTNYRLIGTQFSPVEPYRTLESPAKKEGPKEVYTPGILEDPQFDINVDTPKANAKYNDLGHQPAYLANLAIETNFGLQLFQGLPPNVKPVAQFQGSEQTATSFTYERDQPNVQFGYKRINTGGCMGCHAVAQLNGYSFSFVLLGGQAGASPDSEIDTGFEAPLTKRRINLLKAGLSIPLQSEALLLSEAPSQFVAPIEKTAGLRSTPKYFDLLAADARVAGSPFRYGDGVQFVISAHENPAGTTVPAQYLTTEGGNVTFSAQPGSPNAATWYLYNPEHPASTGDVLRRDNLAFQNAAAREFLGVEGTTLTLSSSIGPDNSQTQWNTTSLFSSEVIQLQTRRPVGAVSKFGFMLDGDFTIRLVDSADSTRPLRFGDTVNLHTGSGYLQQVKAGASTVNTKGSSGQGLEAWILVDFLAAESNGLVQRLTDVAFRNTATGALLSADINKQVTAVKPTKVQHGFTNEWNIIPADP